MHIPDGYMSPETCFALYVASLPVLGIALKKVTVTISESPAKLGQLGAGTATAFLIMMFNLPIPGGTSAHAIGGTLLAILLDPWSASITMAVALAIQALIFGDGGLLTYGANYFNMGIVMPFAGYAVFRLFRRKHPLFGAGMGAYFGVVLAALFAALELGIQPLLWHTASGTALYNPYHLTVTVPAMLLPHLLIIGPVEAIVTALIVKYVIANSPDLIGQGNSSQLETKSWLLALPLVAVLTPLGLIASNPAWGEWSSAELGRRLHAAVPTGLSHSDGQYTAPLTGYEIPGTSKIFGTIIIAMGVVIVLILVTRGGMQWLKKAKQRIH